MEARTMPKAKLGYLGRSSVLRTCLLVMFGHEINHSYDTGKYGEFRE